jgi:CheY-like chemotaxis protein
MLVEDESLVAMMMEDLLAELGCDVVASLGSLREALDWVEQADALDGALLDVNLGGEMVFPLAEALSRRKVPFVFATGYGALADERFARAPLIHKPVSIGNLEPLVSLFGAGTS